MSFVKREKSKKLSSKMGTSVAFSFALSLRVHSDLNKHIFIMLTLRPIAVTMAPVMYSRNPDDT
jgi:hypothetical protein